jgi:hypothetical protein
LGYFKDAQEVYDTIGELFTELAADDELAPKFRQANTIVQYRHSDPDSTITVRLKEDEPTDVEFGETEMEPEVVMSVVRSYRARFGCAVNVTTALRAGGSRPAARSPAIPAPSQARFPRQFRSGPGSRRPGRIDE